MFYNDVFGVLGKYRVKYVVVGGTAVNLQDISDIEALRKVKKIYEEGG